MHCETCGRRVDPTRTLRKGMVGALVVYREGLPFAWCPEHARHRPPWYGRAGWPYMRELDRLWVKAEAREQLAMVKDGGRDLIFRGHPPFTAGEVIRLSRTAWCVIEWVRQSSPGVYTVRVRRFADERPRMLRPGGPPLTDPTRMGAGRPSPDEIENARIEGNYQTDSDPLDGGQVLDAKEIGKFAVTARARRAELIREVIEGR